MSENTDVAVIDAVDSTVNTVNSAGVSSAIAALNDPNGNFYSSISNDTFESRMEILKAVTSSKPISEELGNGLLLSNILVQEVELVDENTGAVVKAPRVTLIDVEGNAYHGTSVGLFSSVRNILGILGEPSTWDAPVLATVVEAGKAPRKYFTIQF